MRKIWPYWCGAHMRNTDFDYFKQLDPGGIRIFEADAERMRRVMESLPYSSYFPRWWAISEEQYKGRMDVEPEKVGIEHAHWWDTRFAEWSKAGVNVPRDRTYVVGINEPRMWPEPGIDRKTNWQAWFNETLKRYDIVTRYNVAMLNECKKLGLKATALNLSVGWPPNLHDAEPPYWDPFEPVHEAIVSGDHILMLHEYWYCSGPQDGWGWLAGRFTHCPWRDVKIVIGECGIENQVDLARMQREGRPRGWKGSVSSHEYATQLKKYVDSISQDPRVWGAQVFLTDYFNREWESQDTDGAHADILAVFKGNIDVGKIPLPVAIEPVPVEPVPVEPVPTSQKVIWPFENASEKITQFWGANPANYAKFGLKGHNGLDMGCLVGTPILSIADGEVMWEDFDADYGNYVRIYHPQFNVCSFYAHLSERLVKVGDIVKCGQVIGKSGNTGNSTGPHLHLEIRKMKSKLVYDTFNTGFGGKAQLDPFTFLKSLISK